MKYDEVIQPTVSYHPMAEEQKQTGEEIPAGESSSKDLLSFASPDELLKTPRAWPRETAGSRAFNRLTLFLIFNFFAFPLGIVCVTQSHAEFIYYCILPLAVLGYFFPTLVAVTKGSKSTSRITLLNLFLGWTIFFWVFSLVMSVRHPAAPVRSAISSNLSLGLWVTVGLTLAAATSVILQPGISFICSTVLLAVAPVHFCCTIYQIHDYLFKSGYRSAIKAWQAFSLSYLFMSGFSFFTALQGVVICLSLVDKNRWLYRGSGETWDGDILIVAGTIVCITGTLVLNKVLNKIRDFALTSAMTATDQVRSKRSLKSFLLRYSPTALLLGSLFALTTTFLTNSDFSKMYSMSLIYGLSLSFLYIACFNWIKCSPLADSEALPLQPATTARITGDAG